MAGTIKTINGKTNKVSQQEINLSPKGKSVQGAGNENQPKEKVKLMENLC